MKKHRIIIGAAALILCGCASNSVVEIAPGVFLLSATANSRMGGEPAARNRALETAAAICQNMAKTLEVQNIEALQNQELGSAPPAHGGGLDDTLFVQQASDSVTVQVTFQCN